MTKPNPTTIVLSILCILLLATTVVLFLRKDGDTWVCNGIEWVKHGNPSALKPAQPCGEGVATSPTINPVKYTEFPINNYSSSTTEIDISYNNIKSLPSQIDRFTNLQVFILKGNKLNSLPAEIGKLSKLTILDPSDNDITDIPAEIGNLSNLKTLDLSGNDIDEFPNEMIKLTNLEVLNLTGNPVKPDHLKRLEENLPTTKIVR